MNRNLRKQAEIGRKILPKRYEISLAEFWELVKIFEDGAISGGIEEGAYINKTAYIGGVFAVVEVVYHMGFAAGMKCAENKHKRQ